MNEYDRKLPKHGKNLLRVNALLFGKGVKGSFRIATVLLNKLLHLLKLRVALHHLLKHCFRVSGRAHSRHHLLNRLNLT